MDSNHTEDTQLMTDPKMPENSTDEMEVTQTKNDPDTMGVTTNTIAPKAEEITTPAAVLASAPSAPTKLSPLAQKLATVTAAANKQYALKNYSEAAETYAQAAEIQDSINGENNPLNADILFYYGRALFQCALSKSDVLGGLGGEENGTKKDDISKTSSNKDTDSKPTKKGLFSFQGDENFEESDEEEDAEDGEGEEEEEDDFSLAFGILNHARELFVRRLEAPPEDLVIVRQTQERLADVYDLLGEVSLESEAFHQAVTDFTSSLELREKLYPVDSTLITEAHYKLSLALEFAAPTKNSEEEGEEAVSEEDKKKGRDLAAKHMELAIASCKQRIVGEEEALKKADNDKVGNKSKESAEKSLEDARDMVKELEQRLQDLMAPPAAPEANILDQTAMNSILGSMLGGDPEAAKKMLEKAISGANDLGNVVRKKEKKLEAVEEVPESSSANGKKRKAEDEDKPGDVETTEPAAVDLTSKKPRVTTEEEEAAAAL